MADNTSIQWCHHTLNPWLGCAKVHAGCTHCYAEKHQAVAMRVGGKVQWGEVWQGGQRVVTSDSTWEQPARWARAAARAGERRRVFCASLADVLEVPPHAPNGKAGVAVEGTRAGLNAARSRLWGVIQDTAFRCPYGRDTEEDCSCASHGGLDPGLDWLLLTKRPENWRLVPEHVRDLVWLGTSVSDQKTADEWVPRLLQAEGFRLRFLSVEPLVGPVDLRPWLSPEACTCGDFAEFCKCRPTRDREGRLVGIDWVIVGGESGPKARPCDVEWVQDIVRQCAEAGVPCFVKQLGTVTRWDLDGLRAPSGRLVDKKGGDPSEWPESLRVRQLPEVARG